MASTSVIDNLTGTIVPITPADIVSAIVNIKSNPLGYSPENEQHARLLSADGRKGGNMGIASKK